MTYRDDLGAARAKIEVLEEQLRALREEKERAEPPPVPPEALPLELAPLPEGGAPAVARSPDQAQVGLAALEKIEALREEPGPARRARRVPRLRAKDLPTLLEHNQRAPEHVLRGLMHGTPNAGVLCPVCAAAGKRVEMYERASKAAEREFPMLVATIVGCPGCKLWALKF